MALILRHKIKLPPGGRGLFLHCVPVLQPFQAFELPQFPGREKKETVLILLSVFYLNSGLECYSAVKGGFGVLHTPVHVKLQQNLSSTNCDKHRSYSSAALDLLCIYNTTNTLCLSPSITAAKPLSSAGFIFFHPKDFQLSINMFTLSCLPTCEESGGAVSGS